MPRRRQPSPTMPATADALRAEIARLEAALAARDAVDRALGDLDGVAPDAAAAAGLFFVDLTGALPDYDATLDALARALIVAALTRAGGRLAEAGRQLGLDRRRMWALARRHPIDAGALAP